jgi:hypothetical protein
MPLPLSNPSSLPLLDSQLRLGLMRLARPLKPAALLPRKLILWIGLL